VCVHLVYLVPSYYIKIYLCACIFFFREINKYNYIYIHHLVILYTILREKEKRKKKLSFYFHVMCALLLFIHFARLFDKKSDYVLQERTYLYKLRVTSGKNLLTFC
jgi:hypothetical protein